jgi:hypothetical protein
MRGMRMWGMRMWGMKMRGMRMGCMGVMPMEYEQLSVRVTWDVLVQLTAVAGKRLHRVQPGNVTGLGAGEHAVQCKESEGNMQPMLSPMPSARRLGDSMVPCHERSHQHASTKHKPPWIEYAAVVQNISRRHGKAGRRHGKASRRHQMESRCRQKASKHHQHVIIHHQIAIRRHQTAGRALQRRRDRISMESQ